MSGKTYIWDKDSVAVNKTNRPTSKKLEEILGKTFYVLDHGFIRVVDYMGDDNAIVQAARVSYGAGTKTKREDKDLIKYLMRNGHWSPFEMNELKLHVKLPIFVARQWMRHKGNVNEYSCRYSESIEDNYIPEANRLAKNSKSNKQGSGDQFTPEEQLAIQSKIVNTFQEIDEAYNSFIKEGLARELSRVIKPVGSYTEFYWKTNLRDMLHFCRQRSDSHAQKEIRVYSDILRDMINTWCPVTYSAYVDYIQNAYTLSGSTQKYLFGLLNKTESLSKKPSYLGKTEWTDFCNWFKSNM